MLKINLLPPPPPIATALVAAALLTLASCGGRADLNEVNASVDNLLTSVNVQNATAVYYKGDGSRAGSNESGYFKLDINGNEMKLEFADSEGKSHNIPIEYVVNASPRYMFFQPNTGELHNAVLSPLNTNGFTEEDDQAIADACQITCIADRTTGKLYKIPRIALVNGSKGSERNGIYYLMGSNDKTMWGIIPTTQIYAFNPSDLTVKALLPEGQGYKDISINSQNYVAYFGEYSQPAKAKCPGGGIKVLGKGNNVYTIDGTFYTADENMMYRWLPNGSNNMVSEPVCRTPENVTQSALYDSQKDVYLFKSWGNNEWGPYTSLWKFDGNSFTELTIEVPDEFFRDYNGNGADIIETNAYWYAGGYKMSKSDYAVTSFNISSDYQILDIVGNPEGSDLSFTAIRYSDAKKVIGKIKPDDTVVIESVQSTSQDIYNLIPLN